MEKRTLFFIGVGWAILFMAILFNPVSLSNSENMVTGAVVAENTQPISNTALGLIIPLLVSNIVLIIMLISEHKARKKYEKIF
jgi:hypothetical protein